MAQIVGGIGISHVPAIGRAIANRQQEEPYWAPFFEPLKEARRWIARVRPDAVVVVYNDHGLNFFLDNMPTFAIGAADEYRNDDEGWGLPIQSPYRGDPALSWKIVEGLVERDFDVATCQEMLVDHACTIPLKLFWPNGDAPPIVPIAVNTVQHPLPSARRCYALGRAIGDIVSRDPGPGRVMVLGTGGLSHQLEGARAGFINTEFDRRCLDNLGPDPETLTGYTSAELVQLAGSQGVELLNWLVMRGTLGSGVRQVMSHYHVPISNTATGLLVLEAPATTSIAA